MNYPIRSDIMGRPSRDPAPATPEQESFLSAYAAYIQGQVVAELERHGQHEEPEAPEFDEAFEGSRP